MKKNRDVMHNDGHRKKVRVKIVDKKRRKYECEVNNLSGRRPHVFIPNIFLAVSNHSAVHDDYCG